MRHAIAAACLVGMLGCASDRSEVAKGLTGLLQVGQSEDAAQCEAALLEDSDLSDEGVVKVALGVGSNTAMDDKFDLDEIAEDLSADDKEAFRGIAAEFADCMD
jgi:hypothetical protein